MKASNLHDELHSTLRHFILEPAMAGACKLFIIACMFAGLTESAPTGRYGHAMAFDGVDRLWLFGGIITLSDRGWYDREVRTNELWYFDLGIAKWAFVEPFGDQPPPRDMHALVFDVYIGTAPSGESMGMRDIWMNDLWVIGGVTTGDTVLNDVWSRDPVSGLWSQDQKRQIFSPRSGHVAALGPLIGDIWTHGGRDGDKLPLGDLYLLRTPTLERPNVTQNSSWPVARAYHAAASGNGCIWLHGGVSSTPETLNDLWCLDPKTGFWTAMPAGPRRAHHVAVYGGEGFWIHGGVEADNICDDLWQFDVHHRIWNHVSPASSSKPAAVRDHAAAFAKGKIWIHSGWFKEAPELARDLKLTAFFRKKVEYNRVRGAKAKTHKQWEDLLERIEERQPLERVDNRVWTGLWSFDIHNRIWTLESFYESPATVNLTHAKLGLFASAVSFGCMLLVVLLYFELTLFRFKQLGCKLLFRPVGWGRERRATFLWYFCLCLLAWSIVIAVPGLFWVRWTMRSELTELVSPSMFVGPVAYSAGLVIMSCCFIAFVNLGMWTSQDETGSLMDPRVLALFLLDADIKLVRFEFLLELHESKRVWPRRQEAESLSTASGQPALMSHRDWLRKERLSFAAKLNSSSTVIQVPLSSKCNVYQDA